MRRKYGIIPYICSCIVIQTSMTRDERWQAKYFQVVGFIKVNHRNPSKHRVEEHLMLNWIKTNRKALNAGKLKVDRVEAFGKLLTFSETYIPRTGMNNVGISKTNYAMVERMRPLLVKRN